MKFYNENGKEICKKDFICKYSKTYYICQKKIVTGFRQSSRFIEDEIEKILTNGISASNGISTDIVRILAWKIGKIKHKESQESRKFEYAKGWENSETSMKIKIYKNYICINDLVNCIQGLVNCFQDNIDNLEALLKEPSKDTFFSKAFSSLKEINCPGIGTVYLITLLYFISKGCIPIYDRFASMALEAILNDVKPLENKKAAVSVKYICLPSKTVKDISEISKMFMEYRSNLMKVFGDKYEEYTKSFYSSDRKKWVQKTRDIDRALWVYGHRFEG